MDAVKAGFASKRGIVLMAQAQKQIHRACEALAAASAAYPDAWKRAELYRSVNGQPGQLSWPAWCYLPLGGWYAIVARAKHGGREIRNLASLLDVSRLAALGAWRMTQGIYRFPAVLRESLLPAADQSCATLYRLPEWCMYIEASGLETGLHGFWVHLEQDANDGKPELRLLLDEESGLTPLVLPLGDWSVGTAVQRAIDDAEHEVRTQPSSLTARKAGDALQTSRILPAMAAMLVFLCSDEAVFLRKGREATPANPLPKPTKQGARLFPAASVTEWELARRSR